jgi:hypothetical protein
MQRKGRKYEVVAAAAKASREPRGVQRDVRRGATPMIEVSDADYRTVHLPCDALEERVQPVKKGGRKPGD